MLVWFMLRSVKLRIGAMVYLQCGTKVSVCILYCMSLKLAVLVAVIFVDRWTDMRTLWCVEVNLLQNMTKSMLVYSRALWPKLLL